MRKRNLIADAFFNGISAFSEQSGANGFDSRAEYGGFTGKGDLTRMICTAKYADYDIEYVYTASGGLNFNSVFSFRIIFDRSMPFVKYSPYDLMYKIDENDFTCYTYGYIESPEKMTKIINALTPRLYALLDKLSALCRRKADMSDIFDKFSDSVNAYYGKDVFRISSDTPDEDYEQFERYLESYCYVDDAFYVSRPYAQFLNGDYNAAYNGMRRMKNKSYYQIRLMSFMASLNGKYEAAPEGCASTADAIYSGRAQITRLVVSALLMVIPCFAALVGIHYISSLIIYHGAIWSDAWFLLGCLGYLTSAFLPAVAAAPYTKGITLMFYGKERRRYLSELDNITFSKRQNGCVFIVICLVSAMIVFNVILASNSYAAFYDDGVRVPSETWFNSDSYSYDDVEKLVLAEGQYSVYGKYVPSEQYILVLKNGRKYQLSYEVTNDVIKEKIIPIITSKGIPVTTVRDADDLDFVP